MSEETLLLGEPDDLDKIVAALREFPGWPNDDVKDREFARQLRKAYPGLDLIVEIRSWMIWMLDHDPQGKGVRVRARFNNWCKNAVRFGSARGTSGGVRSESRRASTRARSADDFGETSEQLTRW